MASVPAGLSSGYRLQAESAPVEELPVDFVAQRTAQSAAKPAYVERLLSIEVGGDDTKHYYLLVFLTTTARLASILVVK